MRKHGIALGVDAALIAALIGIPIGQQHAVQQAVAPPTFKPRKPVAAQPYTGLNRQQRRAMQAQENKALIANLKRKVDN